MKKVLSLLIALVLTLSPCFVAFAKTEAVDITLSMYCNRYDADKITGKYKDNLFYLPADILCEMAGYSILESDSKKLVIYSYFEDRNCEFVFSKKYMTDYDLAENMKVSMPCFKDNGDVYISALHFLRYFGANVVLEEKNNPQLIIFFQYSIFDAINDYINVNLGEWFYWDEVDYGEGKYFNKIVNAGVVALINRDSNIFRMALNPRGIEREAIEEILAVIVKNEGQDAFYNNDHLMEEANRANDFLGIYSGVIEILADEKMITVPDGFDDYLGGVSTHATLSLNVLNALESMKQFDNISTAQKNLLRDTILAHKEDSEMLCGDWKNIYKAAKNVDSRIQSDFGNYFAARRDAAVKSAYGFLDQAAGVNPISLAWNGLVYTGKILGSDFIDKETQYYNAYNCSMVQYAANELLVKAVEDLKNNNWYSDNKAERESHYNQMKNSLILQLKATMTTRQYLVKSQYLDYTTEQEMSKKICETAVLLNKLENCVMVYAGIEPEVNEDLSWMADYNPVDEKYAEQNITVFEEMLNGSGVFYYDSADFSSLTLEEIIKNYVVCSSVPIGLYNYFSDDEIYYTNFIDSPDDDSDGFRDPEQRFFVSYELDADTVNWILENVFDRTPDTALSTDYVYYYGDKVYVDAELGGGGHIFYTVKDYSLLSGNTYEIAVEGNWEDTSDFENYRFEATPAYDAVKGVYWKIHSYYLDNGSQGQQGTPDEAWKTEYINLINNNEQTAQNSTPYTYYLINVDDDGIPELYMDSGFSAGGAVLYSYKNGAAVSQHIRRGGMVFIENQGLFLNSNGNMDHYYDFVYILDENGISCVFSGNWNVTYSPEYKEEYYVDDVLVSKEDYTAQMNQYYNEDISVYPEEVTTGYDGYSIIDVISAY